MDVAAGREVHDRVGAPADRPDELLHLVGRRRDDGRIADIGVDLDEEVPADRHRLDLGMVDVRRDDGAAARDLGAHEFGRDMGGISAPNDSPSAMLRLASVAGGVAGHVLAMGDVAHLLGDDAGAGEFVLRHELARLRPGG